MVWGRPRGGEVGVRRRFERKKCVGGGVCDGEADFFIFVWNDFYAGRNVTSLNL